jgi:pimeloyl-ACP methyl ester carboxylesterase
VIYYEESGDGPPLIFSHGLGGSHDRARELVGTLPGVRTIIYDNRGHGRTGGAGATFDVMVGDREALMDHLGIDAAVVGGVSMGAGIAAAFALRAPKRVRALVLARPAWLDAPNPPNLEPARQLAQLRLRF